MYPDGLAFCLGVRIRITASYGQMWIFFLLRPKLERKVFAIFLGYSECTQTFPWGAGVRNSVVVTLCADYGRMWCGRPLAERPGQLQLFPVCVLQQFFCFLPCRLCLPPFVYSALEFVPSQGLSARLVVTNFVRAGCKVGVQRPWVGARGAPLYILVHIFMNLANPLPFSPPSWFWSFHPS